MRNNSYITTFGTYEFWEVNLFELGLEGLALEEVRDYGYPDEAKKVESYLQETRGTRDNALQHKDACNQEVLLAYLFHFGETILTPQTGALKIFVNELQTNTPFSLSEVPNCHAYGEDWKLAMSSATEALEESLDVLETRTYEANTSLETLIAAGVCSGEYKGASHSTCIDHLEEWQQLKAQESLLTEQLEYFDAESSQHLPNTAPFRISMEMVWAENGLFFEMESLEHSAESTLTQADVEYHLLKEETENQEDLVQDALAEAEDERLYYISSSPFVFGTIETGGEQNIQLAFESILQKKEEGDKKLQSASQIYAKKQHGYLKNASIFATEALSIYLELPLEIEQLMQNGEQITYEMQAEAQEEIDYLDLLLAQRAIGSEAEIHLEKAHNAFEKGNEEQRLGVTYLHYRNAAREARIAKGLAEGYSLEEETAIAAYERSVEQLLHHAEYDGLNVDLEKLEFKVAKGRREAWALETIEAIEASILEKAQLRYAYLETVRRNLFRLLALSESFADIEQEVVEIEGDAFAYGRLDYHNAIGRLKAIEDVYQWAQEEIEAQEDILVSESIEKDVSWNIGTVMLEEPTSISAVVLLYNPTPFSADETEIIVDVPVAFQFTITDISYGQEYVKQIVHNRNGLLLQLQNIEPKKTYIIEFQKQKILAHGLQLKIKSEGKPGGTAEIEEEIDFELDYAAPLYYDAKKITIDGFPYRSRVLSEGLHTLVSEYEEAEAFEQWEDNYNSVSMGVTTRLEYDIFILPNIDLDSLQLFIPQKEENVVQFKVSSATGERISNKQFLASGFYSLHLHDLKANETAQLRVRQDVQNVQEYVENQLSEISSENLGYEAIMLLEETQTALEQNESNVALEKLEQLKNQLEKDKKELFKHQQAEQDLVKTLQAERDAINTVLLTTENQTHSFLGKLVIRNDFLQDELVEKSNESLPDRLQRLDDIDQNWIKKELRDLEKESFKEYNTIKEEFLARGDSLEEEAFSDFEKSLQRLEISRSLEDLPSFLEDLNAIQQLAIQKQEEYEAKKELLEQQFNAIELSIEEKLTLYSKERKDAQGSMFESWFTLNIDSIEENLKIAKQALKRNELVTLEETLQLLQVNDQELNSSLTYLASQATTKLEQAERIYYGRVSELNEDDRSKMLELLNAMRERVAQGEYAKALKVYERFLNSLPEIQEEQNNQLLLLGLTAAFILAALIIYMLKQMRSKPKKKWKKLKPIPFEED